MEKSDVDDFGLEGGVDLDRGIGVGLDNSVPVVVVVSVFGLD